MIIYINIYITVNRLNLKKTIILLADTLHNKISIVQLENREQCQSIAAQGGPGLRMCGRHSILNIQITIHFA